jgi:prepilin-type N-terminal cleavage/methylation domain-containing protein
MPLPSSRRNESGFTLVEVLVSVLVLALFASGITSLVGAAARAIVRARIETTAVLLAHRRLEQLRSLPWGWGSAHLPSAGIDRVTDLSGADPGPGGAGLSGSPAGALDSDTVGFVDYLDHSGRWLSRVGPSAGTRFIRRWSVEHVAGWPDVLLLRVRVVDLRADVPDVVFSLVRTRTAG